MVIKFHYENKERECLHLDVLSSASWYLNSSDCLCGRSLILYDLPLLKHYFGMSLLRSKVKHMKSKKIMEAYFRATDRFSGLFKALTQRAWHSQEVDPDNREAQW